MASLLAHFSNSIALLEGHQLATNRVTSRSHLNNHINEDNSLLPEVFVSLARPRPVKFDFLLEFCDLTVHGSQVRLPVKATIGCMAVSPPASWRCGQLLCNPEARYILRVYGTKSIMDSSRVGHFRANLPDQMSLDNCLGLSREK